MHQEKDDTSLLQVGSIQKSRKWSELIDNIIYSMEKTLPLLFIQGLLLTIEETTCAGCLLREFLSWGLRSNSELLLLMQNSILKSVCLSSFQDCQMLFGSSASLCCCMWRCCKHNFRCLFFWFLTMTLLNIEYFHFSVFCH